MRRAFEAGVNVALGSDYVGWPPDITAREFGLMVEFGLAPMAAIKAGTSAAATLLGLEETIGSIQYASEKADH